ncbi:LPXTG cell wall anchor domain-containing protein [Streptomyces tanashiensis]|uniref:LPXTG cell wall anchor domain-containing protein n=1 Tax=Streptomyces tanashiensis TaxID=67367 RepID=A0ABY6R0J8_9ACTN|nr:LPXTG cell wall anchor domain-containing protein [Streptomyces tanashiensis]UZX23543.1 LPXTG cell wall anchor domain-containing protein [Streptomyces tanashiensis]
MRRSLIPAAALVAAMAGSVILAPTAFASDGTHTYPLHQKTPIAASEASHDGDCKTIPASQDGWHFVIPGNGVDFTKLTVTFDNGAPIVITSFGPPNAKHAYVGSAPGAKLTSAEAEVNGVIKQGWFNLSHTCPATDTTGGTTGEQTTGGSTGEQTTGGSTTGETTTGEQTTGGSTTGEQTTGGSTTGETTTGGSTTGETTSTGGSTTGETTTGGTTTNGGSTTGETTSTGGSATGGSETGGEGNLAETGSSAPVGILAAAALALAAAGAVLVTRRRKATQN